MKNSASKLTASTRSQIYGSGGQEGAKGYVQIVTNFGTINVQLHCDIAPRICKFFLSLSESSFFDYSDIPRLIPDLIMGLKDVEKNRFEEGEIDPPSLPHNSLGTLTASLDSDKVSFSITMSRCPQYDGKQTVFGRVVGGLPILNVFNSIPTDGDDRPSQTIRIQKMIVLTNPFASPPDTDEKKIAPPTYIPRSDPMASHPNRMSMEIGKYIDWDSLAEPFGKKTRTAAKPWSFTNW